MARIRSIKPAFFTSVGIANLTLTARLTFIGLWTHVDDAGRAVDDARLVKAALWPLDDKHTPKKVDLDLAELDKHGYIERYTHDGAKYLRVRNWHHQKISHPQPSKTPASPEERTHSRNVHGTIPEDTRNVPEPDPERSPPDRRGRDKEGKSSSTTAVREPAPDPAPDDDDRIVAACRTLAQRRLDQRTAPDVVARRGDIGDRNRWLAEATTRLVAEHHDTAAAILAGGSLVTADELADLLEPDPLTVAVVSDATTGPVAVSYDQRPPCTTCGRDRWLPTDPDEPRSPWKPCPDCNPNGV